MLFEIATITSACDPKWLASIMEFEGDQPEAVTDQLGPLRVFAHQLHQVGKPSEIALDAFAVSLVFAFEPFDVSGQAAHLAAIVQ